MSKPTRAFASALAVALLLSTPMVMPVSTASATTKEQNAELEQAIRQTNTAVGKVKNQKEFNQAVLAKKTDRVMEILLANGAFKTMKVVLDGPIPQNDKIIRVNISGKCCPPVVVVTIRF